MSGMPRSCSWALRGRFAGPSWSQLTARTCKSMKSARLSFFAAARPIRWDMGGRSQSLACAGVCAPVAALEGWLRVSGISAGQLFRPIAKGGGAAERRISAEAVARILKKRTQAIGCDPKSYSGHSLRAGFATEAARLGVPKWRIKAQTGSSQHRPTPSVTLPRVPVASSVMPISMCSIGSKSTSTG
jgi:hypothetical protein